MARLPRLVLPGIPYHVTQRGNRRQQTFFEDGDYALYRDLLAQAAERAGVQVWSQKRGPKPRAAGGIKCV
jgi:putative transposase